MGPKHRWPLAGALVVLALPGSEPTPVRHIGATVDTTEVRTTTPLMEHWRFIQNDSLSDQAALASTGSDWTEVTLPHTWNAKDAASLDARESYRRGIGWYRLEFPTPSSGARHWIEFGAASLVADVWLNGEKLGQHRGGFTAFRFDLTDALSDSGANVLLVKTDNRAPKTPDDPTAIDPLGGDFNVNGGLYRHVALISTPDQVHIDLNDLGGPGVYATTTAIDEAHATVRVRTKLKSHADRTRDVRVRTSLLDDSGRVAASDERAVSIAAGGGSEAAQELKVTNAHRWQGIEDPYQYALVVELLRGQPAVAVAAAGDKQASDAAEKGPKEEATDKVVLDFGIREIRFDPTEGFFLNGVQMPLRGVAIHQDYLGKGWATTTAEMEESMRLIMEVGANAVRLGHYPFAQYVATRANELGLALWVEKPSGLRTTVGRCTTAPPPAEYIANAKQQLQETIRQFHNHAAVVAWSVGNETAAGQSGCDPSYDNVTPYLRELHELAKEEDPSRPTTLAEFTEGIESGTSIFGKISFSSTGITDIVATNRYYPWYNLEFAEFGVLLDSIRARQPDQPLGISEYGAGAAISHHTDNWLGGPPEVRSPPDTTPWDQVTYQPEEYGAYFHELNWGLIESKPYLWGTFVWNMFDFGSDHRREGDVIGVNTKGLVTFDRKMRKDAFYFYKANWSAEPVTYIASRRYTDRAYAVNHVKVYSNADSVQLSVNGQPIGVQRAGDCGVKTCVFRDVRLRLGANTVVATGHHRGRAVRDSVQWSVKTSDVNIAAGRLATGYRTADGRRFGSDHYFVGGEGAYIVLGEDATGMNPPVDGTDDDGVFKYVRHGTFHYEIPLDDGRYEVTLGFLEPDSSIAVGERVFSVTANGQPLVENFDVLQTARTYRTAVRRSFPVTVSGGKLELAFKPIRGEAIVSNIAIRKQQ